MSAPRANFGVVVAAGLGWFAGFLLLRIVASRRAVKAGRGEYFWLLTDFGWMRERGRPWTSLGRFTFIWLFGVPALIAVGLALAVYLGLG